MDITVSQLKNKSNQMENQTEQFLVVVQGSQYPPTILHDTYNEALMEATRITKKENKRAYVVKVVAMVELTAIVTEY